MKKMTRSEFIKTTGLAGASLVLGGKAAAGNIISMAGAEQTPVSRPQPGNSAEWARNNERRNRLAGPVTAKGKIGNMEFSRLILGGNPIGGWMHSRDLRYVSALSNAYLTEGKKMEIFQMAENCGVDTILGHPVMIDILNKYWSRGIGKIKWISDCGGNDFIEAAKKSIDGGCCAAYCQGMNCDALVEKGDFKTIEKGLDIIRNAGMPAGLGAHKVTTLQACLKNGLVPDFWMKTLHHLNYWSAMPDKPERDNRYCNDAEETIKFINSREEPVIGFKVLAAGAIPPADGIRYGLENGSDFICLGMFDFNMIEDVNLFNEIITDLPARTRPWRG